MFTIPARKLWRREREIFVSERRSERRLKVLKEGRVLLDDYVAVNCSIRDITPAGARLEFEGPVCLPSVFRLRLVSTEVTFPATVVWQRKLEAGIRFTGIGVVEATRLAPRRNVRSAA
jgi:hypothetical protein